MEKKITKSNFSVALGLFDYINPIFYTITTLVIALNMFKLKISFLSIMFIVGAIISLIFGFSIPTVKLLVGLGKMKFKMPVNLVCFVNSGILISGIALSGYALNIKLEVFVILLLIVALMLGLIMFKTKKFNTIAVLIGAVGYILIYSSLIIIASNIGAVVSIVLYSLAILLFVFLVLVGIKSNLNSSKVHWTIEISNVLCQGLVAISTVILFLI